MNTKYLTALLGVILMIAGNSTAGTNEPAMPGGNYSGSVTDSNVIAAAQFAIQAEEKVLQKDDPAAKLSLVKIISVKQQVVAGLNYRLSLKVKLGDKEKESEAVVWWQAWRKEPYELTKWEWR